MYSIGVAQFTINVRDLQAGEAGFKVWALVELSLSTRAAKEGVKLRGNWHLPLPVSFDPKQKWVFSNSSESFAMHSAIFYSFSEAKIASNAEQKSTVTEGNGCRSSIRKFCSPYHQPCAKIASWA